MAGVRHHVRILLRRGRRIPATSAESASAADIAAFYDANRTTIRAGLIGAMFASALLLPFFTGIC